jgi:hypothetical protein
MVGEIISEWWAELFRNGRRRHSGIMGDIARNRHEKEESAIATVMQALNRQGEGILLIYDNAIDVGALKVYLPNTGAARVLITSTSDVWRAIATTVIEIRIWPREIGADFLIARSGRAATQNARLAPSHQR